LLAEGKVVGWFQDGSKFGPRALGHRSILADPRIGDIQKFINSRVKFRENFRPFAPSVLLKDVSECFIYEGESPYMIMVDQFQPKYKNIIPGVIHKDGSCRIQTVTEDWNKKYFNLLEEFKKETGLSIVLNTSFNRRGMPIVETPEQALSFFAECELDCLIIDNIIVQKIAKTVLKENYTNDKFVI
jgi:carbamoyltransferase